MKWKIGKQLIKGIEDIHGHPYIYARIDRERQRERERERGVDNTKEEGDWRMESERPQASRRSWSED